MITTEEKIEIEHKISETVNKLNKIYNFNLPTPKYYFDIKGTTAGIAKSLTMSIHLNPILAKENWIDFIEVTIPHEICHLGVFQLVKTEKRNKYPKPHGPTWKLMMFQVGASSRTTHDFNIDNVKRNKKTFIYNCDCGELEVSAIIHNKIKKGTKYSCKACNKLLTNGKMKLSKKFSRESPNRTTNTR